MGGSLMQAIEADKKSGKLMDKRAEAMTKKCFDGLFQIWEKMGSENLRKDKVDYILKNFEDILEIYIIIEKKNMEKMKKNIQELHLRRRELHKDLGMDCTYTPTNQNLLLIMMKKDSNWKSKCWKRKSWQVGQLLNKMKLNPVITTRQNQQLRNHRKTRPPIFLLQLQCSNLYPKYL